MMNEKKALLQQLPQHGWEVINIEDHGLEWWADEIWTIKSVWNHLYSELFITFLIDPESNVRGTNCTRRIWGVRASLKRPTQWGSEEGDVYWGDGLGWRNMLDEFLVKLSGLAKSNQKVEY